jgi:glycerate kinase
LRGIEVAQAIAAGFKRVFPDASYELVPVADGGDGTLDALVSALGGREVEATVTGPNGAPVLARYGLMPERGLAVVEMAQASGLALMPPGTNDPMTATSRGTGELIAAALGAGAKRIIVAIGGSATNDAGTGALAALGARFLDASRRELPAGGAALARLNRVDASALDARLHGVTIEIASDVTNPLCGPNGASAIYGPQKGASPEDVRELDGALAQFASVASELTGTDIRNVPGAGAAGGFGGGFLALAGAQLRPGADLVLDVLDFSRRLEGADLVVTGEGRIDKQTLSGKAPYAVARMAHAKGIPVVAVAGSVALSADDLETMGIARAVAIAPPGMSLEEAMRRAAQLTESAAYELAASILAARMI